MNLQAAKFEGLRTFVTALLLALVFRSFAYEPFHIPSGSMLDTLYEGDYLFVSKFSYGYSNYSFPFSPNIMEGRTAGSLPERGDVAVFRLPSNTRIDYIKRVIGLPGDTIEVRGGALWINGAPVNRKREGEAVMQMEDGRIVAVTAYSETLPGGRTYRTLDGTSYGEADEFGPVTVPEGHYFMMGDNRDNSVDSRYGNPKLGLLVPPQGLSGVGFLPLDHFVGRAEVVAFSFRPTYSVLKFWRWPEAFRKGRFWRDIYG